ncbi:hypothetical protein OU995_19100 [Roseateles sp. SL47]|uniref:hypothetical protein n=1 Tax=Roseateles sp. SL47 TaxID=2995138 RepID=UPI002271359E|nr:hypothetical protein [Roseateles sp. SL47]WAC71677.1 hypothetical protein OU995_19100 [Roseateles sp. SL47]
MSASPPRVLLPDPMDPQATDRPPLRLCLVAPSGSGKSTTAGLMRECFEAQGLTVRVLKLAAPLYRLQSVIYAEAGLTVGQGAQDQCLLESLAQHLRRIQPHALARRFLEALAAAETDTDVIINDDLRDDTSDWPALRQAGFSVIKLVAQPTLRQQRMAIRNDLSVVVHSPLDAQMARIPPDFVLTNNGSLAALRRQVEALCTLLVERAPA